MVSTAKVAETLRGIDFPADKQQIVDYARKNRAPSDVLNVLERTPCPEYGDMADLLRYVGKVV